jgi:hypothetical protein
VHGEEETRARENKLARSKLGYICGENVSRAALTLLVCRWNLGKWNSLLATTKVDNCIDSRTAKSINFLSIYPARPEPSFSCTKLLKLCCKQKNIFSWTWVKILLTFLSTSAECLRAFGGKSYIFLLYCRYAGSIVSLTNDCLNQITHKVSLFIFYTDRVKIS